MMNDDVVLSPAAVFPAAGVRSSQFFGGNTFGKLVGAFRRLDAWAMRREVIVVTDCATFDDRAALALLALSPRWRLIAVIATARNEQAQPQPPQAIDPIVLEDDTVTACLESLPLKKLPQVVPGSPEITLDGGDTPAADFIIASATAHSQRNRLLVVVLGAATDVAIALAKDPELEHRIDVVAAAFDCWPDGGSYGKVQNDVEAWQMILDSAVSLTIASAQTAEEGISMSAAAALSRLRDKTLKSGEKKMFAWLDREATGSKEEGESKALTGMLAVAQAFGHTQTTLYRRPALKNDCLFMHGSSTEPLPCQTCIGEPRIRWITAIDEKRFWAEVVSTVAGYDAKGTKSQSAGNTNG